MRDLTTLRDLVVFDSDAGENLAKPTTVPLGVSAEGSVKGYHRIYFTGIGNLYFC